MVTRSTRTERKPSALAATVHAPGARPLTVKLPWASEVAARGVAPGAEVVMVTAAPGMTAPVGSTTVPERVPVGRALLTDRVAVGAGDWATAGRQADKTRATVRTENERRQIRR